MRKLRFIETAKAGVFAAKVVGQTQLDMLHEEYLIRDGQFDAGNKWLEDWVLSGFGGRRCSWSDTGIHSLFLHPFERMSDTEVDHWVSYVNARRSIPMKARIETNDVIVWDRPVNDIRLLRLGLNSLAMHYKSRFSR